MNSGQTSRSDRFSDVFIGGRGQTGVVLRISGDTVSENQIRAESVSTGAVLRGTVLSGLSAPSDPEDAANKRYVDSLVQGLVIRDPVVVASTQSLVLSGLQAVDGVPVAPGFRVLVKDQVDPVENGVYIADMGPWSRAADLQCGARAARYAVYCESGLRNGASTFVCGNSNDADVVCDDELRFSVFTSGVGVEHGLYRDGTSIGVLTDDVTLGIGAGGAVQIRDRSVANVKLKYDYINLVNGQGLAELTRTYLGDSVVFSVDDTVVRTVGAQTLAGPKTFLTGVKLSSGSYSLFLKSAPIMTSDVDMILPSGPGVDGQFLRSSGTGYTYWDNPGDVRGPGSSSDNQLVRFAGTTGGSVKGSSVYLSDSGSLSGVNNLSAQSVTTPGAYITGTGDVFAATYSNGTVLISGQRVSGLGTPAGPTDATNKAYVDDKLHGIRWMEPARLSTGANVSLVGLQVVDGVQTRDGDRILVAGQSNQVQNGVYLAATGAWVRAPDAAAGASMASRVIWVSEGAVFADTGFICTSDMGADSAGSDPLNWLLFTGSGSILPGAGLSKSGNVFNVNVDGSSLEIVLNSLQVKALGITSTHLAAGSVTNAKLVNSAVTVTTGPGSGLSGGAAVSLGSSVALSVDASVVRTSGAQTVAGQKTFADSAVFQSTASFKSPTSALAVDLGASAGLTESYSLAFPVDKGAAGQALRTDAAGALSWGSAVAGPVTSGADAVARFSGTSGQVVKNSLVTISDSGLLSAPEVSVGGMPVVGARVFFGVDTVGQVLVTGTKQALGFTSEILDAGYTLGPAAVTVAVGGVYEIHYAVTVESVDMSGGPRATVSTLVEINSGAGFTGVPGSAASIGVTEDIGLTAFSVSKTLFAVVPAAAQLRVCFVRSRGTTTCRTRTMESSLGLRQVS